LELFPRGKPLLVGLGPHELQRRGIGQKEKFTPFEAQYFREAPDHLVRRMALAGLEMADIGSRGLNPPRDFLLRQIELAATFTQDVAESALFFLACHQATPSSRLGAARPNHPATVWCLLNR